MTVFDTPVSLITTTNGNGKILYKRTRVICMIYPVPLLFESSNLKIRFSVLRYSFVIFMVKNPLCLHVPAHMITDGIHYSTGSSVTLTFIDCMRSAVEKNRQWVYTYKGIIYCFTELISSTDRASHLVAIYRQEARHEGRAYAPKMIWG